MTIDEKLRQVQQNKGLTIAEMAEICSISKNSLQNYMRKTNPQKPGLDALVSIAVGLGVSVDWLLDLEIDGTDGKQYKSEDIQVAARTQITQLLKYLCRVYKFSGGEFLFKDDKIHGLEAEEHAIDHTLSLMALLDDLDKHGRLTEPFYLNYKQSMRGSPDAEKYK